MDNIKLALDKSARRIDADGRLHVERSHISKAAVNPYYGKEIPGFEQLGLVPDKIYRLLRDPVELERGAATFARLPILMDHAPGAVTTDDPYTDMTIGAIGSQIAFTYPYLDADICIWDKTAITAIDTDKIKELSCAYRYVPIMEAGDFEGSAYDGRMTEIQGNHLALVEVGRAGPDVVVADKNPFINNEESKIMIKTKLGKALFASLCGMSTVLAADSALPGLVGNTTRKTDKAALRTAILAKDASLDSTKLDSILDAILDVEQEPTPQQTPAAAADESPADKVRAMLADKVDAAIIDQIVAMLPAEAAADEKPDDKEMGMKPAEVKAAMDSLRKDMREAEDARRDVRDTVGDVVGKDSAADIYGFALDHLKVDRVGIEGMPALRAMYKLAVSNKSQQVTTTVVATDSAGAAKRFPGLSRIGVA